jgi:hypothetical protein
MLGIRVVAGRSFTLHDSASGRRVVIVNQAFATQFRLRANMIGTSIRSIAEPGYPAEDYEIVGVAADAKYDSLRENIPPVAFAPEAQNPYSAPWVFLIIRATDSPAHAIAEVRRTLAANNPRLLLNFTYCGPL